VPLNSPTVLTPRHSRAGRVVAIAVACVAAGTATFVIAADDPAPATHSASEPTKAAFGRYYDIEASKAVTMRALGRRETVQAHRQRAH
jgi:hypothetical protein